MTSQPPPIPLLPSSDPSEPSLPDATLGPQDMQKGRTSAVPGRESRRLHLALVSKKVIGTKFCISCEYLNKIVLPERSGQLSPVSGLISLPQLQTVGPSPWVNLPAIQAHHQNIVEQLVTIQNLKTFIESDEYPATSTSYLAYPATPVLQPSSHPEYSQASYTSQLQPFQPPPANPVFQSR